MKKYKQKSILITRLEDGTLRFDFIGNNMTINGFKHDKNNPRFVKINKGVKYIFDFDNDKPVPKELLSKADIKEKV